MTAQCDVANKIGTYLKALAAKDNGVPFYVALPHSTIDWTIDDGRTIPIEERNQDEVLKMPGRLADGSVVTVEIAAPGSPAGNPAFDVTPARLITGFIADQDTNVVVIRGADGQSISLTRDEIDDLRASKSSLMPGGQLQALTDQQIRDLFAYLRSTQPLADRN